MNLFKYFGWTPWTGDRPVPTQDSKTQKNAGIRPYLKRDSNAWSQSLRPHNPQDPHFTLH